MKKLIAVAVVFSLAMGGLFAADIGGTVFGAVRLLEANSAEDANGDVEDPTGSAGMTRIRLEGAGENDDGTFGAWLRFEPADWGYDADNDEYSWSNGVSGLAWWKPIDQFKLTIGGNPDGIYGKEGFSGWMFYQMPSDIEIVSPHSVWGGPYFTPDWWGSPAVGGLTAKYRDAFYGGFGGNGLMLEIKPTEMIGINIIFPYFNGGDLAESIFKNTTAQLDINLDFGNIALTFEATNDNDVDPTLINAKFYLFFGLTAVDNLDLSLGVGFQGPRFLDDYTEMDPLSIGLAAKYDVNDSFGLKARLLLRLAGFSDDGNDKIDAPFFFGIDLLPYFAINDSLKVFCSLGLFMRNHEDWDDPMVGFHVNPYLQVGAEWGPTFYAGIRLWSNEVSNTGDNDAVINFAIPIGIQVSF